MENKQMENNMNIGLDNCAKVEKVVPKEPENPFKATVPLMLSSDYVGRFVAEYRQLKIRYERLKAFNNKIEAARSTCCEGKKVEEPKHDCSYDVLRTQQRIMGEYLHILEVRAVVEDISLLEV